MRHSYDLQLFFVTWRALVQQTRVTQPEDFGTLPYRQDDGVYRVVLNRRGARVSRAFFMPPHCGVLWDGVSKRKTDSCDLATCARYRGTAAEKCFLTFCPDRHDAVPFHTFVESRSRPSCHQLVSRSSLAGLLLPSRLVRYFKHTGFCKRKSKYRPPQLSACFATALIEAASEATLNTPGIAERLATTRDSSALL